MTKELKRLNSRKEELEAKVKNKMKEGVNLVGEKLFKECFEFFLKKCQYTDELNGRDM
jgi:hypothetical protein